MHCFTVYPLACDTTASPDSTGGIQQATGMRGLWEGAALAEIRVSAVQAQDPAPGRATHLFQTSTGPSTAEEEPDHQPCMDRAQAETVSSGLQEVQLVCILG
jgi:hypothetical protein